VKKSLFLIVFMMMALHVIPGVARATVFNSGSKILDHGSLYTWQITSIPAVGSGFVIGDATLTITGLTNWANESWKLWVNVMDQQGTSAGWSSLTDPNPGDTLPYDNNLLTLGGTQLGSVVGTTTASTNWVYTFTSTDLATLKTYINNGGTIAFGFDPDCHFNVSNVSFSMNVRSDTPPVPEPASFLLVAPALLASWALRRKFRAQRS